MKRRHLGRAASLTLALTVAITPLAVTTSAPAPAAAATTAAAKKLTAKAVGQSKTYSEARSKLYKLKVKGRAANTGYTREKFGQSWADQDRNGCDTRNDILRRDLSSKKYKANTRKCKVTSGTLKDKYTGKTITFKSSNATAVQIDHVVALNDAWRKGAQKLTKAERTNFANDPLNLRAVQGAANQQKSNGDAATWLPKNKAFRCQYVATQVDVKTKYRLWVTTAERAAMKKILKGCDGKIPQIAAVPALAKATTTTSSGSSTGAYKPATKETCPAKAPIKGNQGTNGWKYHVPGGRWYGTTHPEECFATEAAAKKAGYEYAKNQ